MAWQCDSESNVGLVANLKDAGIISSKEVESAMLAVDRRNYAPSNPYQDSPQYLGYDATISAPHMHAHCLELLKDTIINTSNTPSVLDVGCGSGYLAAVFARIDPRVRVIAIDYVPELTAMTTQNLNKSDAELLSLGRIVVETRNGWEGVAERAPFDAIHVGAAADGYPRALMEQLKVGGKMIIPVGKDGESQALVVVERLDEGITEESFRKTDVLGVRYVPLVKGSYKARRWP